MTPLITLGQFEIPVIAAGNGWLVVEKPWGMSVHNDPGADLVSFARRRPGTAGAFGIHPVHRLDRETSGVMILCTEREVLRFFARQFEAGEIGRAHV
jgi:23S rRNA-/tRNA-specific pseudouridylate synthase